MPGACTASTVIICLSSVIAVISVLLPFNNRQSSVGRVAVWCMTGIAYLVAVGTKSLLRSEMYKASTTLVIKELFRTPQQSNHGKPQLRENVPMGGPTKLLCGSVTPQWWFSSQESTGTEEAGRPPRGYHSEKTRETYHISRRKLDARPHRPAVERCSS
jgi:hypothetical protein